MSEITYLNNLRPHRALEVICVKCYDRWMAVALRETPLVQYECKKCGPGFVIGTGQEIEDV